MPYPALPDRVVPYNNDGSVVKVVNAGSGVIDTLSAGEMDELNDEDSVAIDTTDSGEDVYLVFFLADALEVTAIYALAQNAGIGVDENQSPVSVEGSNDTSNGIDGNWTAGTSYTPNDNNGDFDSWRKSIATIDFSGVEYGAYRIKFTHPGGIDNIIGYFLAHLYGIENATPSAEADLPLIFTDPDDGDARWDLPVNFGDVPAGTSQQETFKIFNNHATDQANNVSLDVIDTDDIMRISENVGGPWVLQISGITIASQALSAEYHIKSEPAAPPTPLEPERASIEVSVGSWT